MGEDENPRERSKISSYVSYFIGALDLGVKTLKNSGCRVMEHGTSLQADKLTSYSAMLHVHTHAQGKENRTRRITCENLRDMSRRPSEASF